MTIFIGADHRGFHLKDILISYLQEQNIRVEDMGNYTYDPHDDFPQFSQKVAEAVLQNSSHLGIVICGSGVGVSIAANRYNGIYCGLGINAQQIQSAREHDHINILALGADCIDEASAKQMIDVFIKGTPKSENKYLRRIKALDRKPHTHTAPDQNE